MAQSDKEALNLYQLIGAPLLAVIQAEAQAVQVSADFIKQVGFETAAVTSPAGELVPTKAPEQPLQEGGDFGGLRMARFSHQVRGTDGLVRNQTVNIPVLSLFPIPLLQVKSAEFDFAIRVLDHKTSGPDPTAHPDDVNAATPAGLKEFLSQSRIELKGRIARDTGQNTSQRSSDMQLKVKVRMEQADIPAGLSRLFQIMDQTIHAEPDKP